MGINALNSTSTACQPNLFRHNLTYQQVLFPNITGKTAGNCRSKMTEDDENKCPALNNQ